MRQNTGVLAFSTRRKTPVTKERKNKRASTLPPRTGRYPPDHDWRTFSKNVSRARERSLFSRGKKNMGRNFYAAERISPTVSGRCFQARIATRASSFIREMVFLGATEFPSVRGSGVPEVKSIRTNELSYPEHFKAISDKRDGNSYHSWACE